MTRIALTGDSIITRRVSTSEDPDTRALIATLQDVDVAFTNLEVVPNDFRGYPAQESGGSHFATHSWVIDDLVAMGFDLFACAHNHALDYSIEGLLAGIEALNARGVAYAGVGRNLGEARLPAYLDHARGSVGLVACSSSFGRGQQAGTQRPDMHGRPGLNPLRYEVVNEVTAEQLAQLRAIAEALGIERLRQERVNSGFGFAPEEGIFPFMEQSFRASEQPAVRTSPRAADLDAIAMWVRDAKARADLVIASIHAHEQGASKEEPAEFMSVFARRMIEAGADIVAGHGPHLLRGMEIYQGKPIFYSLGNFIGQNDLVQKLPGDAYERFRVDPTLPYSDVFRARNRNDEGGFAADRRYWESLLPICSFEAEQLVGIELLPVTLGYGRPSRRRGWPTLATSDDAVSIIERFAALSVPYGTTIERVGERGLLVL
jgi:poly-gamma-glutamate synthesis protein (capsule biosynthesis protein)